jgi:hypothetical protein
MYLGAAVLVPFGFEDHPQSRYPLIVNHGHFPSTFGGFRETPPDPNLKPDYSERFRMAGYNRVQQEYAHKLYLDWISKEFPRFVIIEIQHANPFYDDSYAVNSANLGPYGDAINYELIPFIEKQFRCLGEGWARFYLWRFDRRMGSARDADVLSGNVQRVFRCLSRSDRLSRLHGREYL